MVWSWKISQAGESQKVYDIIDCGPDSRFSLGDVIAHNSSYGMGPKTLRTNLMLQGINIPMEQAFAMYKSYWRIYKGVKDYEQFLLSEWHQNGGWVVNGLGRPVCCDKEYEKDIVNRVVQSTGHDVHMIYMKIVDDLLTEAGLKVTGIVWDFHDESIVECDNKDADAVAEIMGETAYGILNKEYLGGSIPLKGGAEIVNNMADVKCED